MTYSPRRKKHALSKAGTSATPPRHGHWTDLRPPVSTRAALGKMEPKLVTVNHVFTDEHNTHDQRAQTNKLRLYIRGHQRTRTDTQILEDCSSEYLVLFGPIGSVQSGLLWSNVVQWSSWFSWSSVVRWSQVQPVPSRHWAHQPLVVIWSLTLGEVEEHLRTNAITVRMKVN